MDAVSAEHTGHYTAGVLDDACAAALREPAGGDVAHDLERLAGLDQFHTGDIVATHALAEHAAITPIDHDLDVGGGLGEPARMLAHTYGCRVTVLALTEAYYRAGEEITALRRDLPGATVGRRLALHEVVAGSGEAPHYPVFWARSAAASLLATSEARRAALAAAGFQKHDWQDTSAWALEWLAEEHAQVEFIGDGQASAAYWRHLLPEYLRRAVEQALRVGE